MYCRFKVGAELPVLNKNRSTKSQLNHSQRYLNFLFPCTFFSHMVKFYWKLYGQLSPAARELNEPSTDGRIFVLLLPSPYGSLQISIPQPKIIASINPIPLKNGQSEGELIPQTNTTKSTNPKSGRTSNSHVPDN